MPAATTPHATTTDAAFILQKWAARRNLNPEQQRDLLLAFLEELGSDAAEVLDRFLATTMPQDEKPKNPEQQKAA